MGRSGIQRQYLNIVKAIYSKPVASIKLNGEKLEGIPLKSRTSKGCPLSPYLFNIVLEVLARAIRQKKGGQRDTNWKGRSQTIIVTQKNSTRELLQLINNFGKVAGYKLNSSKSVAFLHSG